MFLSKEVFSLVVHSTPLISIDLIVENEFGEFLLGKRNNRPAQGYWFVPGGRVYKDELLEDAYQRISLNELGLSIPITTGEFYGIWQHFYDDNFFGENFSTHYIVLSFRLQIQKKELQLPNEQHSDWQWFTSQMLISNSDIHQNTRAYFQKKNQMLYRKEANYD